MTAEAQRMAADRDRTSYWRRWGPYLSERQWGTVREDYSPDGSAWDYFPHDHARSRAYRWGEDGLGGISDNHQRLCFAIALWNGKDPILKERVFGLSGPEGNHGEDPKDYYFYLDNTPSHAHMRYLYKYPQRAFPYDQVRQENQNRDYYAPEFELLETGIFDQNEYFDVFVDYAKATDEDILVQIRVVNRADHGAELHLLPTLWFRNTWSWFEDVPKPHLKRIDNVGGAAAVEASHPELGQRWLYCQGAETLLFTENETNKQRLFVVENPSPYVKDGINDYIVQGRQDAVNPAQAGTKVSPHYHCRLGAGEQWVVRLRLSDQGPQACPEPFGQNFDGILHQRYVEANEFYDQLLPGRCSEDARNVQRQAFAGLLWTKQFYHYVIEDWLKGDPTQPAPHRPNPRNEEWPHLYNDDIISMPDKWEFPWYAVWDSAFHVVPLALIDPDFAKRQMDVFTREWYLHPNGQMPAYEWHFSDVNPPVHAWGTWQVYQIEKAVHGQGDRLFLERVFQKLLLNFTWWVNRRDNNGNNIFQGGFLGLDNIGIFDRSSELPTGGYLEQSDGTSWMAMYCLNMLEMALELAETNPAYEDIASKFFEHFLHIADAMNHMGDGDVHLWDEQDQFFYDVLHTPDDQRHPMRVRSMVGLIPLYATAVLKAETFERFPDFTRRFQWFVKNRPALQENIGSLTAKGKEGATLLAIVSPDRLRAILQRMLDEGEFLSDYGVRSLSRAHADHPYTFDVNGETHKVGYEAAESASNMFGGNSNWRGPVWFPVNYLLIDSLRIFHDFLGDGFTVEFPSGSGQRCDLNTVADELSQRLITIFLRNEAGNRAVHGGYRTFQADPHWRDLILFYEYFNGDNGAGVGANHQTGWTGLVAALIYQCTQMAEAKRSQGQCSVVSPERDLVSR
ncbi:MGH1-like glycoside hydrolase domain-containing protein [Leptolyngbya sp. KIOST-1]|uniref:MGH1-like glycoside hydrolase domain-containing protein n=1 Tax=Leptolyngbya sp. KIOST-1 TaxID=1229172 RepID=UPI00055B6904|nr:glucosidase [Leptolyngbya sp. KIOST-1]